jgi:hypothetical protein
MNNYQFKSQCWKTGTTNQGTIQAPDFHAAMALIRQQNPFHVVKSCIAL